MVSFLNQYQILFNKAKADLSAANILHNSFKEGNTELDLEVICFHLQQCAEKLLKATLSKNQIDYPKVHDLETLLTIISNNDLDLITESDKLIELNDYSVEGRYAVMQDDLENIENIFEILNTLMKKVGDIINKNSLVSLKNS